MASKTPTPSFRTSDDVTEDVEVPEPLTFVSHKAGNDPSSRIQNALEPREMPIRPDSAKPGSNSPQLSPGLMQARPVTSNGTVTQPPATTRYYNNSHRRNPSSESTVSLSVSY